MQIFDKKKFNEQFTKNLQNLKAKDCYLQQFASQIVSDKLEIISRDFKSCLIYGRVDDLNSPNVLNQINKLPSNYDEEQNPHPDEQFDLVISNLTMQYNNDVVGALVQYYNNLQKGGLFICTLLGGDTLKELKEAMIEADLKCFGKVYNRIIPMIEIKQMGGLLQRAKFDIPICVSEEVVVTYPDIYTMLKELKSMGLGNCLLNRIWQYKKDYFKIVEECYREKFPSSDGRIAATFEILTASGSR